MKTNSEQNSQSTSFSRSTYAMILRAQDRRRNALENVVYLCLMLSVVAAIVPLAKPVEWATVKSSSVPTPIVAAATAL